MNLALRQKTESMTKVHQPHPKKELLPQRIYLLERSLDRYEYLQKVWSTRYSCQCRSRSDPQSSAFYSCGTEKVVSGRERRKNSWDRGSTVDKTQRTLIAVIIVGIYALIFLLFKYYSMIRLPIEREEPKAEAVRQEETLRPEAEPRVETSGQEEALRGTAARKEEASRTKRKEDQHNKKLQKKTQHYECLNAAYKTYGLIGTAIA